MNDSRFARTAGWLAVPRLDSPGAHTYVTRCASCHGLDGKGQSQWMPPLAGATSALAKESASAINITLNGSQRVVAAGVPTIWHCSKPSTARLSISEPSAHGATASYAANA